MCATVPTILSVLVITLFIMKFLDSPQPRHGTYRSPEAGVIGTLVYSIAMMLMSLPTVVITYRYACPSFSFLHRRD